jgi:histidine kinase
LTTGRTGETAWAEVVDTGKGIAADDLERIFERFYRLPDPAHPAGRGIGLTIARSVARAHRGDIVAMSAGLGRGATFRLTLPIAAPPD